MNIKAIIKVYDVIFLDNLHQLCYGNSKFLCEKKHSRGGVILKSLIHKLLVCISLIIFICACSFNEDDTSSIRVGNGYENGFIIYDAEFFPMSDPEYKDLLHDSGVLGATGFSVPEVLCKNCYSITSDVNETEELNTISSVNSYAYLQLDSLIVDITVNAILELDGAASCPIPNLPETMHAENMKFYISLKKDDPCIKKWSANDNKLEIEFDAIYKTEAEQEVDDKCSIRVAEGSVNLGSTGCYKLNILDKFNMNMAIPLPDKNMSPISDPPSCTGDVNLDGTVDLSDLILVDCNMGILDASWVMGDLNGDKVVDIADYLTTRNALGTTCE